MRSTWFAHLPQENKVLIWVKKVLRSDTPTALLFLLPSILVLGIFNFYPILAVFRLSLYKWDNLAPTKTFIGLANYLSLFNSSRFWNSISVTFEYALAVTVISLSAGLILAVLLNNRFLVLKSLWRSLYFLPAVTPTVAAAMVWMLIFNPGFGYVNVVLKAVGIRGPNWLADPVWALPTVILLGIWRRLGFNLIIYLAALQAIPLDYYESAEVDGANGLQRFFKITVPLVNPTTVMLVILGVIDSFLVFDQVMVLTRGGPVNATEVIGFFMYLNTFSFFKMGYGAAISVIMFVIIVIFTLFQWRLTGLGASELEE